MTLHTTDRIADHRALSTRALLACGVVAGPLFPVVALAQAAIRDGFDVRRHPFSLLSLGDLGWIQVTNFVVAGLLFIVCAIGMRRVLRGGRGGTWGPALIAVFGASQIVGGVFLVDPGAGFPAGAPDFPVFTATGTVHNLAGPVGLACLVAACFVIARRFAAIGERGWARYSVGTGVAVVLGVLGIPAGDLRIFAAAIVLGWGWAALVAARLRSELTAAS